MVLVHVEMHDRQQHVHVGVSYIVFVSRHTNDPHCSLWMEKRHRLTQAFRPEDWQATCPLVRKVHARHQVARTQLAPLLQVYNSLWISKLHPAIYVLLEAEEVAASAQRQTPYFHSFSLVKDQL